MPCWRQPLGGWLDFIVTDPPYGVRAGAKKQGREGKEVLVKESGERRQIALRCFKVLEVGRN